VEPTLAYISLVLTKGAYQGLCLTLGILMTFFFPKRMKGRNPVALRLFGLALMTEAASSFGVLINEVAGIHNLFLDKFGVLTGFIIIAEIGMTARALAEEKKPSWKDWLITLVPLTALFILDLTQDAIPSAYMLATAFAYSAIFAIWAGVKFYHYEKGLRDQVSDLKSRHISPMISALAMLILNQAMWMALPALHFPLSGNYIYTGLQTVCWTILAYVLVNHKALNAAPDSTGENGSAGPGTAGFEPSSQELYDLGERLQKLTAEDAFFLDPEIGRDQLAQKLQCPRALLSHYLSSELHTTFYDFINGLRIHHAQELIRKGATDMTQLATECGYESLSSFEKAFLRIAGCLPQKWKK